MPEILKKQGIPHFVLNAKQHEREAEIVAQAGRKGMVTIATNMAGRGTDIVLGGNPEGLVKQWRTRIRKRPKKRPKKLWHSSRPAAFEEHEEVVSLGRSAHPGYRAPRVAPYR